MHNSLPLLAALLSKNGQQPLIEKSGLSLNNRTWFCMFLILKVTIEPFLSPLREK